MSEQASEQASDGWFTEDGEFFSPPWRSVMQVSIEILDNYGWKTGAIFINGKIATLNRSYGKVWPGTPYDPARKSEWLTYNRSR